MISASQLSAKVPPDHRFVLLGASNLTLGLPLLTRSLRSALPDQRIEILAAHGHGRSYLNWSYVIIRGLPGIQSCELWDDLNQLPPAKNTYALVTDLGCDLMYGAEPSSIIESVGECLRRLQDHGAKTVFLRPPLERLNLLSEWQYYVAKNTFFPGPTPRWAKMLADITQVDEHVLTAANQVQALSIAPVAGWYGMDPIHISRASRVAAWSKVLSAWEIGEAITARPAFLGDYLGVWSQRPSDRSLFWLRQNHPQPAREWNDSTSLWLY
ncbi:hypothetical protein AB1L42_11635 [Thalassoglobus sp. JC818]|uniref:hypothetical protein n=1 Tax=Thalassoglobus sp. JC818 TaxID=3232136 RepID=UPI0034595695